MRFDSPRLLRVNNVAKRLAKSERMVRVYAKRGWLPAVRDGRLWFFDPRAVEEFKLRRCRPLRGIA